MPLPGASHAQFITHTVGRMLGAMALPDTPINTKGYESLLSLVSNTNKDSFDLYYGLFMYNEARAHPGLSLACMRVALFLSTPLMVPARRVHLHAFVGSVLCWRHMRQAAGALADVQCAQSGPCHGALRLPFSAPEAAQ